jgi:hypothetical protein
MSRIRKKTDIELDRLHKSVADGLIAFNVTKQRIVDLCNERITFLPWRDDVNYSTWHRALDGQEVWVGIIETLEELHDDQLLDPRKYLPGPPPDDIAPWMKQIAGAKWWHSVLGLSCDINTVTGWMTGRKISQALLDDVRAKAQDWWARVDAACTQADKVRLRRTFDKATDERWNDVTQPHARTWDSFLYSFVHEDGHSIDEARALYVEMNDLDHFHVLRMIDLADPQLPCELMPTGTTLATRPRYLEQRAGDFDELWASGLPRAIPRAAPAGFDVTPYEETGRWGDRRAEDGPFDVNEPLYRLFYRARITPFWDEQERCGSSVSEIVAVSEDGQEWREPSDVERRGWDRQGLEIARYRDEHGEQPANAYHREVEEAERALHRARQDQNSRAMILERGHAVLDAAVTEAERAVERARRDY